MASISWRVMNSHPRTPKTPARHHRARSETKKTPLTPSVISNINTISISSTNPFHNCNSGPSSPIKCTALSNIQLSESFKRQANLGVVRRGGIESRLNVVTHDYVRPRPEIKRSRSTPAANRATADRFISRHGSETEVAATLEQIHLNLKSSSPGHTSRLACATGVPHNRRILGYHEPPPTTSSSDSALAMAREYVRPLYAPRPGTISTSTGAIKRNRNISTQPERVLDAPGLVDDFYLNLIAWSARNTVAVALESSTYVWNADRGSVNHLGDAPDGTYVASVDYSNDGIFLGVGLGTGGVELWDIESCQKLRTMGGHETQVATLSWNQHILTSGCGDGSIWHHDVRVPQHKVMELIGHTGEVCGLKWRSDGELLASGGNDNVVNIWDGRLGNFGDNVRGSARWTKRNHTAAVKAVAWCPWQPSLLATGGGTNDATINIWNSTTGARLHSLKTPSQITSIIFAPGKKELLSTHGYPTNSIMVHAYPSLERVIEVRDAHDSRVLFSCIGPAGDIVCTGAGDENLKFWRIWDAKGAEKSKKVVGSGELGGGKMNSTKEGILCIR